MNRTHKFYILLFIISLIAFLIRVETCREIFAVDQLSSNPPAIKDMHLYKQTSEQIFDGTYHKPLFGQPFYFLYFLPFVYLFFGKGIWGVLITQSLLGALTVWLIGISTSMLSNRKTGLLASSLFSLAFIPTLLTAYLLILTLKMFLVSLLMFIILTALNKKKLYHWTAVGIIMGCLILTRANTIVFLPVILIFSLKDGYVKAQQSYGANRCKNLWTTSKSSILIIVIVIIMLLPSCIYNSILTGRIQGTATGSLVVLAISNNPEAPPGKVSWTTTALSWMASSDDVSVISRIWNWISCEPLTYGELIFRKLLLFWDSKVIGNNINHFYQYTQIAPILNVTFLPTSFFLLFFLIAFFSIRKSLIKKRAFIIILSFIFLYWLTVAASFNLERYRLPILPLLTMFIAISFNIFFNKKRSSKKYFKLIISIIIAIFIIYLAYPLYRYSLEKHVIAFIQPKGLIISLDKETIYSDSGPVALGGHTAIPLIVGSMISKQFAVHKNDIGRMGKIQLLLQAKSHTNFTFKINGKLFYLTVQPNREKDIGSRSLSRNDAVISFKVKIPQDGKFNIILLKKPPMPQYIYIDLQRNFSRTWINERLIDGELVGRLIAPKQ